MKWSNKAQGLAVATNTPGRKHCVVVSDPTFWCVACGAFADTAPKLLSKPCRGKPQGRWKACGMIGQLRVLRSGRHPNTLRSIPPPVPLAEWLSSRAEAEAAAASDQGATAPQHPSSPPRAAPAIAADGTELTDAFLRRGQVPTSTDERLPPIKRLKMRQAAAALRASGIKRKLEEFLNEAERDDPDLISFWSDDVTAQVTPRQEQAQGQPKRAKALDGGDDL